MLDMRGMSVGEIIIVNDFIGAADSGIMTPSRWPSKFLPILDWYRAEPVTWRGQVGGPQRSLSRERIVKRVANYLGASHPINANLTATSVDDAAINDFMSIEVADRPLPYYAVMSIAQEILRAAGLQAPKK